MKRFVTIGVLFACATAFAADTKPAPKTAPKTETKTPMKAETKTPESTELKIEEPDQKDPKNKETDTKAQGEVKKDSF